MSTELEFSTDRSRLDVSLIHRVLSDSYWAANIPLETLQTSIDHSLCYGVYQGGEQVAFARVITDQATFAYLADVFVIAERQGEGIGKALVQYILADDRMAAVRRFCLATRDAHSLYESFGFKRFTDVDKDRFMQIRRVTRY
ncbi:acetyltransferase, GNAT family protein [Reinekea sp. MED297]|uniref:Acetyltransferase, GNAT family protein n=1 Tax=Reinekea blandensis MED297 TaxID=314283 RepID=A4BGS1_9GAMM|nr:acetyltransferase, GNAT family protein [Reinekea sp. MED297] [Reinekea blandensis MED297]